VAAKVKVARLGPSTFAFRNNIGFREAFETNPPSWRRQITVTAEGFIQFAADITTKLLHRSPPRARCDQGADRATDRLLVARLVLGQPMKTNQPPPSSTE
jgi:hypothetical protein